MKRAFDLVVFDFDGTLVDARKNLEKNINYTLKFNDYPTVKGDDIYPLIGIPLINIFKKILPETDTQLASKLVDDYRKRYKKTCHIGVKILAGVRKTLKFLKKNGFKTAIATAKGEEQTLLLLKRLRLRKYFDMIVGYRSYTNSPRPKPHPDMINYIMKKFEVENKRTVMVGDTLLDIKAGKNAGVYTVAVKTGVKLGIAKISDLKKAQPEKLIDSVKELPRLLSDG